MRPIFAVEEWAQRRPVLRWALVLLLLLALASMTSSEAAPTGLQLAAALPVWPRRVEQLQPYRPPIDPAEPSLVTEGDQALDDLCLTLAIIGFALLTAACLP